MRSTSLIALFIACLLATSCATTKTASSTAPEALKPAALETELWEKARDLYLNAGKTGDKKGKAALAKEGMTVSDECVMKEPESAACYYYRAMNTGVYYEAHINGYQAGIRSMISDCKKVISLDEKYDHAGAYRTLGKIYTDMPELFVGKNGVSRDLDLATGYLEKAAQIDPTYPENQLYLADALLKNGKRDDALKAFSQASQEIPLWKNHPDYAYWKKMNKELASKIK